MTRVTFIIGCTGGGKGALGMALAERLGGEIVSVDSMKIYRHMDIGTAKPAPEVRARLPHHCIDIAEPSESFSVARYVRHADRAIGEIAGRGKVALAVGGTALYIMALTQGLFEGPGADPEVRAGLEARIDREGLAHLHTELAGIDPEAAGRIHPNDRKRIVRALEVYQLTGKPISALQQQWDKERTRYDCVLVGLRRGLEDTNHRINVRVRRMIEKGLREEVAALLAEPAGLSKQAGQALGYAEMIRHLRGEWSLEEAVEQIKINTRQFAKRQRTWFRRIPGVQWIDVAADDTADGIADKAMELAR